MVFVWISTPLVLFWLLVLVDNAAAQLVNQHRPDPGGNRWAN